MYFHTRLDRQESGVAFTKRSRTVKNNSNIVNLLSNSLEILINKISTQMVK